MPKSSNPPHIKSCFRFQSHFTSFTDYSVIWQILFAQEFLLISDAARELPRNVRKILRDARLSLLAMVEYSDLCF